MINDYLYNFRVVLDGMRKLFFATLTLTFEKNVRAF